MDNKEATKNLNDYREQIDRIDEQLVDLFTKRMQIASEIAKLKKVSGIPVLDAKRERELLSRIEKLSGPDFGTYSKSLYETIMALSRSYQHKLFDGKGVTAGLVESALADTPLLFPESAKVACQGVEGAYSQHAAEKLFANPEITFYPSFEGVYDAVEKGTCLYGVLPLENSTTGSVRDVYDLLCRKSGDPLFIVRSLRLRVEHSLLIKKDASVKDVRKIISHDQALSQSANFLKNTFPDAIIDRSANTAIAAQTVAASDGTVAALASPDCASQYGLKIAMSDVQDNKNNYTRFICISKKLEIYPGAQKTSIVLTTAHKPGSLSRVLSRINAWGINLSKLESRPIPGHDFEFMFYFDLDCPVYSPRLGPFLTEMEQNSEQFRYLGTYTEML